MKDRYDCEVFGRLRRLTDRAARLTGLGGGADRLARRAAGGSEPARMVVSLLAARGEEAMVLTHYGMGRDRVARELRADRERTRRRRAARHR